MSPSPESSSSWLLIPPEASTRYHEGLAAASGPMYPLRLIDLRKDVQGLSDAFALPAHVTSHKDPGVTTLDVDPSAWLFPGTFSIALSIQELDPAQSH